MRRVPLLLLPLLGAVGVWWSLPRAASLTPPIAPPATARKGKPLPGAEIFNQPTLLAFRIELSPEALNALSREPRHYAAATVTVDGRVFTNVAIHLKGAAESFRGVDDHPALTVSFNKFVAGRKLFGLRKIHLNNSVQDDSFMNKYVASDLFRAANVPTPRVAFATVELNARKLGLYVLKEGFSEDFLKCHFKQTDGNLYDGGFLQDVDQPLEQTQADGRPVLKITASNHSTATWRATVRVQAGRYRLEGRARGAGIRAARDDKGEGAGLRVSGSTQPRANRLIGDTGWTALAYEFEVKEADRDITCVCELRATKGQVLFDRDSLRLIPQTR